jgi:ATP-binding cassette subfamily F protein uup
MSLVAARAFRVHPHRDALWSPALQPRSRGAPSAGGTDHANPGSSMASPPLLALRDAAVQFDGRRIFGGISVALGLGDRVCLVGRNGTGKSTLLKVLAGRVELDSGMLFRQPGARVAYVPQLPVLNPTLTAGAFVAQGLAAEGAALDADEAAHRHRVAAALDEVEIPAERALATLSGGEGRRISLAHALIGDPDILLLDEPTNHLDITAVEWLEERLAAHRAGLLLISHDRTFLTRLSRRTLWLDRGVLHEHDQGYAGFEDWAQGILAAEAAAAARLDKLIARETVWSREGISARRKRNQGRVRRLAELRRERAARVTAGTAVLGTARAESGGRLVYELEAVSKAYPAAGEATPRLIVRDFSTRIMRGDRVGIIGRNGAGKSTLVGLLTGTTAPDSGTVRRGTNLIPAVFDQQRTTLDPGRTLWESLTDGGNDTLVVQGTRRHVASYLKDFLFDERQFRAKVATLSGGERNRLLLAKILAQPSNVLILDEPTNDLDLETMGLLEDVLADYDGTLLLVTHDRDFLDRVVTSTIAVEGNGVVHEYVGGYSDYVRQRRAPSAAKTTTKGAPRPAAAPARDVAPPRPRAPTRLSFKEQRELDGLPAEIARLTAEKTALESTLAAPDRLANDRTAFDVALRRHADLAAALAAAEERWLVLAERAEDLARRKAE